jgi:YegS/Rv2252/BmrU family lipid kinase
MKQAGEDESLDMAGATPSAGPTRATILVNPMARGVAKRFDGPRTVTYLERHGVEARVVVPGSVGEATEEARLAGERGDDFVFVVGGDGSLRAAALGLAGSDTALAAVPAGTANVFAREVRIPGGVQNAINVHLHGQRVRMDLGRADGQCFLLMAGIGWDAEITRAVPTRLKRLTGPASYVLHGMRMLPRLRTRPVTWVAGGVRSEAPIGVMVLSNTRSYGGAISFAPDALATDGLLDLTALKPRRRGDGIRLAVRLLVRRLPREGPVTGGRVADLTVETPGLPVQLDGDFAGETPMRFTVEREALLVSVPAGRLPAVLNHRDAEG